EVGGIGGPELGARNREPEGCPCILYCFCAAADCVARHAPSAPPGSWGTERSTTPRTPAPRRCARGTGRVALPGLRAGPLRGGGSCSRMTSGARWFDFHDCARAGGPLEGIVQVDGDGDFAGGGVGLDDDAAGADGGGAGGSQGGALPEAGVLHAGDIV